MKIVISLICFVVGILSLTNAAEFDLERSCLKNGGPKAFANLESSKERMKTYFNSVQADFTEALGTRPNQPELAFARICNKVKDQSIPNHLRDVMEYTKVCVEKSQHQNLEVAFKSLISLLQFGCENTKLLGKAVVSPDMQCVMMKDKALQNCIEIVTAQAAKANTRNPMEPRANMTDILLSMKSPFDNNGCSNILTFEQCSIKVMKQCKDKVFEELLDSLYKHINENIPCENLPKLSKSGASPASVVSFMALLISVITVSL